MFQKGQTENSIKHIFRIYIKYIFDIYFDLYVTYVFLFGPSGTQIVFQEGQNPGFVPYRTDRVIQKGQSALIDKTACSRS